MDSKVGKTERHSEIQFKLPFGKEEKQYNYLLDLYWRCYYIRWSYSVIKETTSLNNHYGDFIKRHKRAGT